MGSIVSFVPRPAAKNRRGDNHSAEASVIIFPGVRYERPAELRPDGSPNGGKKVEPPRTGPVTH
jgi:hypothetical protein